MYKDKGKQREAGRERQRRYRASKGVTAQNVTKGVTNKGVTASVRAERDKVGTKLPPEITLHPAIVATIDRLSTKWDGTVDEQERSRRTAIAENYERMYPGRPYTGV